MSLGGSAGMVGGVVWCGSVFDGVERCCYLCYFRTGSHANTVAWLFTYKGTLCCRPEVR